MEIFYVSTINISIYLNKSFFNNVAFDNVNSIKFKDIPNNRIDFELGEIMRNNVTRIIGPKEM